MRIVTAEQLRSRVPFSAPAIFADANYAVPTLAWLQGPFWDWFQKCRWDLGLKSWARRNDCDNFARAYAQAAADCHALTASGDAAEGLAVGEWYYHSPGGPHAICVAAIEDDALTFVEPQNGQRLTLTPTEISSCFFARF